MGFPEMLNEGEVFQKRLEKAHPSPCRNQEVGHAVKDHENVDYRYVDPNTVGPGGVSKPEGPDTI